MDRRSFVQGAASIPLTLGAAASAEPSQFDPYANFLDLIRAWQRHDIDAVLAKLADDIVWYARVGAPPVIGKAIVREAMLKLAPTRKVENWRIHYHAVNGDRLFVEGVDDYTGHDGRRVAVPYAGVIEHRDRLIAGWRDYFDIGTLDRMKAGEPIPEAIAPLVARKGEP